MANIFDGLDKLDDTIILDNLAMLETLSMGNVMKGYGTTVANKGAKLVNGIGSLFGKNFDITEVKEKRIEDYIEEKKNELKVLNRNELNQKLRKNLCDKTNLTTSDSNDMISTKVIDSVAKSLKLGENMTTGQKADSVQRRYLEKILDTMQDKLKKQNSKEAEKTISQIEKNISELSQEEQEDLKKVLNIDSLDGKEIRNVLMKAGTPALIIGGLSMTGFGAFMALTTILHAVFTTILGVTLPFAVYSSATSMLSVILGPVGLMFAAGTAVWQFNKGNSKLSNELMGQLIFASVNACGGSFTVKNENLPSYEPNQELLKKIEQKDLEYSNLVKEHQSLKANLTKSETEYKNLKNLVENYKQKIFLESKKQSQSEKEILNLRSQQNTISKNYKDSLRQIEVLEKDLLNKEDEAIKQKLEEEKSNNLKYKNKLESLNENIQYQNEIIDEASKIISEKEEQIKEYEMKNIQLEEKNKQYSNQLASQDEKIKEKEDERRKEITEKWGVYFSKFEISNHAIKNATKFSKKERWELEKALMELHSLSDFRSASRGKMDGKYEHMGFSLPCGFPSRILYTINKNSTKKVTIEKIYKHNEKIYQ